MSFGAHTVQEVFNKLSTHFASMHLSIRILLVYPGAQCKGCSKVQLEVGAPGGLMGHCSAAAN